MKTLYLIDGYAQFFRAYHAIRTPMTSPVTKEPTNATFGFVGMLLKVLREEKPDYLAVALDVSGDRGTFRSEIFPEYKATRDEPPEGLEEQVGRCLTILEGIGVPVIGAEGYEADDVIATLADRLSTEDDLLVRIVSKDKDLQQLLAAGRVEMADVHTGDVWTEERLLEEKGVTPGQVVDMLALMGDTVDNVPGVPGIGPKTAAKLIAEHGSLDALLEASDSIKGKRGENIRAAAETLPLSQKLVTLVRDIELEFDLTRCTVTNLELAALEPMLRELGFNRFRDELKELLEGAPGQRKAAATSGGGLFDALDEDREPLERGDYTCVRTSAELAELVKQLEGADVIALDTETTSKRAMQAGLCGLSFSVASGSGAYVPVKCPETDTALDEREVLDALRPLLEDPRRPKVGHNLKYDLLVLRRAGVELRGIVGDSMVSSYLVDASRSSHGMDHLALALLGHTTIPITDLIGTGKKQRTFDTVPLEQATPYAAEDADISLRLLQTLEPQLKAMGLVALARDVEVPLIEVLAELEWNGIVVDPEELDRQAALLTKRIDALKDEIASHAPRDFNPDSPKQLASVLFNALDAQDPGLGIKPLKKTKTGYSTDAEVLEKLASDPGVDSPVPGLIVEYRQLTKLVGTYLSALKEEILPETGRIHASFNQTVAATGRLSSSDPNLQNIPVRSEVGRQIRKAFKAPEGLVLIAADYSQIELRILAHLSDDPALIDAFTRGEDIHRAVAAQIHGVTPEDVTREQRDGAKMVNFGIVYGITPFGLARRLGIEQGEAATIIEGYKQRFAGITTFLEECIAQARAHGYVETMLKRRRPIRDIDARQPNRRSLAERMAINSVVQGSAADLIKLAMLDLHRRLHATDAGELADTRMLLQIHDELVFESPAHQAEAVAATVRERMASAMELKVPLVVEASWGADWGEAK